ncbi:putative disease resistance protein RGA3 [Phoenix dactylifera]|uniref:Disease resistance protein RGA3 n=1 Tax=Phoenix dactylifera TaxID=42345 RepID=A0A8B9A5G2_PHODC|nr:putative disease resistance protein RGA3 [Phoenix dactylifera]XP_026661644.2 putative disease resistance protein RGA3 [Phoenix dactylifera]XP_038981875.1 putative disease resistance protein RGA3 [Phoenix dactylifera]XP_038981876.1 putative disease resistance protein RGA3 [Phoenix dactylifera]
MAEGLTVGNWYGSTIIRKLVDAARSIEEADHFDSKIQVMLRELQSALGGSQALISDPERGLASDPAQSVLLGQLRDACYEADDLLDKFHLRILSTKMNRDKKVRCIPSCFMYFKNLVSLRDDLQNLKNLVGELQGISNGVRRIYMLVDKTNGRIGCSKKRMVNFETTSIPPDRIIGREKEKEEIVSILLSSGDGVDVLPLVGMGGVGKTTLAQLVYNDERVKMHFDARAWCYVSADFDIERISKQLLYFLSDDLSDTISDMETSFVKLEHAMSNKKLFLVLDDVWDDTPDHWDMMRHFLFARGARGGKVLVTTRSAHVAALMGTISPIMVGCLSEDECWALIRRLSFCYKNLEHEEWKNLEPIGMQICRKIGGLPLAALLVGTLLRTNEDEMSWRRMLEGEEWWEKGISPGGLLPTLMLSYQHLNDDLRQCFSYCSIFPRGYMFEKHKLVQMWLAQGYIKLDDGEEMTVTLEDVGSGWFDQLMYKSFFQPAEENRYAMHELMHDLAASLSLDDCFVVEDESRDIPWTVRHFGVRTDKLEVLKEMIKYKRLRTLLFFGKYDLHEFSRVFEDMFIFLKDLRVLDLSSTPIKKLPDSFGGLLHLRYLDISNTKIRLLPTSFSRLRNLQVLDLRGCHFQELPKGMSKLINLRYLYGDSEIVSLIERIGELTNLHYIEEFPVRQKRGHGIGELENLMNLRRISIKNLENVKTKEEAKKAKLKNKKNLKALQLEWKWSSPTRNRPDGQEEVLEGLKPHYSLRELSITGYDGIFYPYWMAGNHYPLINLVHIHLRHCHRWENLPSFGQLPCLRILHFENMPALTRIGDQFYGNVDVVFPSLEQLTFLELKNLREWSEIDSHQSFPRLRKIQIKDCRSLTKCPFLSIHSSVEELVINNCGDLGIALPGCLQSFTSLTLLMISHYHHKTYISLSNIKALEKLHLEDCPELRMPGGLHSLANLKKLHIEGCPMLNVSSLPKQPDMEKGLQSLTDVCMDDSILLNDGWALLGSLPSLRILNFQHFNHLGYFSKEQELWFHQLTSIQELGISNCRSLEHLPADLSTLLSLKKLSITNCPKIMSLPENGLPISLKDLQISGCPALEERCSKVGPDRIKIAHIPRVRVTDAVTMKT